MTFFFADAHIHCTEVVFTMNCQVKWVLKNEVYTDSAFCTVSNKWTTKPYKVFQLGQNFQGASNSTTSPIQGLHQSLPRNNFLCSIPLEFQESNFKFYFRRIKPDLYLLLCTNVSSKWIKELNAIPGTLKLLKEKKIVKTLEDIGT